ncbi:MAG TPA: pilus assembly protein PilM [Verrucomicrobiae bacterium]|nr:pilus assembly protein PilM [Verrucomicrobiae bacterium]
MAWPIFNDSSRKRRNPMLVVDMGGRTTKSALVEQRGEKLALTRYALLDAPIFEKKISSELLAGHLREIVQKMDVRPKSVTLTVGLEDVMLKQIELPQVPLDDMRMIIKNNTKAYLQQDLPNYAFDCHIFAPTVSAKPEAIAKMPVSPKLKVLIGGARQELLNTYRSAVADAGLAIADVVPGLIGPLNAFEACMPEAYTGETVALVDIGFKHSSICILDRGEMVLMRIVNIGGDRITAGLAESMNISYAEAEGIKIGMPGEVQAALENQVQPLGRELRASLDFFEHQQDRPVSRVYVSGASSQSELIVQILHSEMVVECKAWNPVESVQLALPEQQAAEMEQIGPQLTVALGAALSAF